MAACRLTHWLGLFALCGTVTAAAVHAAPPTTVSAKELLEAPARQLTTRELRALIVPGSVSEIILPNQEVGWISWWKNAEDGTAVRGNRDIEGRWTWVGIGKWYVRGDGYYCLDIQWKTKDERWCRAVYSYNDALYLGRPELAKDPSARIGRLEVIPPGPRTAFSDSDWQGRWNFNMRAWRGIPWEGEIDLSANNGTFRPYSRMLEKDNACLGRPFPIRDISPLSFGVSFRAAVSEVVQGCEDFVFWLIKIDADTLEGTFGKGINIRLTRK